jgi:hypothetical protein
MCTWLVSGLFTHFFTVKSLISKQTRLTFGYRGSRFVVGLQRVIFAQCKKLDVFTVLVLFCSNCAFNGRNRRAILRFALSIAKSHDNRINLRLLTADGSWAWCCFTGRLAGLRSKAVRTYAVTWRPHLPRQALPCLLP